MGENYAWNVHHDSRFSGHVLNRFIFYVVKDIKKGCLCVVEIRDTNICVPWLRPCIRVWLVEGLRRRHNPTCVPVFYTMHWQAFIIPLIQWGYIHTQIYDFVQSHDIPNIANGYIKYISPSLVWHQDFECSTMGLNNYIEMAQYMIPQTTTTNQGINYF